MLSREQAQALTRCVHLLRPAWSEEGIFAALAKCKDRNEIDVALAAIRAAGDKGAKTPGIIPTPGSHWNEPDPKPRAEPILSREERRKRTCETCGGLDGCKPPAHEFLSLEHAAGRRVAAAEQIDRIRAEIQPTKTFRAETQPTTPRARECETGDNAEEIR